MKQIPKYNFNKQEKPLLEFEIVRLEGLMKNQFHAISKPHQLNFHQLIFISEGSGVHTVDFQKVQFQKNSFIPVAKDQVQQFNIDFNIFEQKKRSFSQKQNTSVLSLIMQFKEALDSNINYKTKVVDICELLGVNRKKLNAALKITSNKTAKEYLDERIILEVKRLLSYSELSIKEIAFKIGFQEASNLTKYFKKHTSYSPQKFREIYG